LAEILHVLSEAELVPMDLASRNDLHKKSLSLRTQAWA